MITHDFLKPLEDSQMLPKRLATLGYLCLAYHIINGSLHFKDLLYQSSVRPVETAGAGGYIPQIFTKFDLLQIEKILKKLKIVKNSEPLQNS